MIETKVADLIRVCWILPRHMEHVSYFLCQADAGAAVGRDVDSRDSALSGHFGGSQEQNVLLGPEGADLVRDVIANNDDLTSCWILWSSQGHPPGHHANLDRQSRGPKELLNIIYIYCIINTK